MRGRGKRGRDDTGSHDTCRGATRTTRPRPAGLAEQIKAAAENMAGAGRPLAMSDLEAHCSGRGRRRGPVIVEALVALGRMRAVNEAAPAWETA